MNAEAHGSKVGVRRGETTHGKYRVLSQLGEGGMGSVYLAVARGPSGFNKLVVLKTLKRDLADDPALRKMFLREARVAARLNHPGVVQTYEIVESDGYPLIVMEYLEGETLARVRKRAKNEFPLVSHLRIIADATGALHHAHELADFDGRPLGLVHRDMTPQNVFVTFNGHVKLLDFGIAKLTTSQVETQSGLIKGKLRYMPPEQIACEPIDRRADIYAVGVMLWEAATGTEMWTGCSDVTVMNKVLNGDIVSPRSIQPQVTERLEAICMKALSISREDRYATAAELEADIDNLLDELGSRVNDHVIGKFASKLFADVRAQTKALIEAQLSKVVLLSTGESESPVAAGHEWLRPEDYDLLRPLGHEPQAQTVIGGLHVAGLVTSGARRTPRPGRRALAGVGTPAEVRPDVIVSDIGRRVLAGIGTLAVLLGLIGIALAWRRHAETGAQLSPIPALGPGPSPSDAPKPPPVDVAVSIRISASPPEAKLLLDGERLPANPFVRSFPADGSQHIVMAEARGYQPRSATFSAERDAELVVDLERKRAAPDKAMAPVAARATGSKRPGPSSVANCNPPYRIDGSGIKTFKLECL